MVLDSFILFIHGALQSYANSLPNSVVNAPRSHCPGFQSRRRSLRWGHRCVTGPHRSDAGKHHIESGYTVLNRRSPGCGPGGFKTFKTRAGRNRVMLPE